MEDDINNLHTVASSNRHQLHPSVQGRLRSPASTTGSEDLTRLKEETASLRQEIRAVRESVSPSQHGDKSAGVETLLRKIQEQDVVIGELRGLIEYQVGPSSPDVESLSNVPATSFVLFFRNELYRWKVLARVRVNVTRSQSIDIRSEFICFITGIFSSLTHFVPRVQK